MDRQLHTQIHTQPFLWPAGDQEARSSLSKQSHERHPSDLDASLCGQLPTFDTFSLPPGLYAPEGPRTPGVQVPNLAEPMSMNTLQTQGGRRSDACNPLMLEYHVALGNFPLPEYRKTLLY